MKLSLVFGATLIASMLCSEPLWAKEQSASEPQGTADAAATTSAPADATATSAAPAADVAGRAAVVEFDFSRPVSFERCQQLGELNAYVDSLPPEDVEHLIAAKNFLVDCQALLESHIADTRQKIDNLKSAEQIKKDSESAKE